MKKYFQWLVSMLQRIPLHPILYSAYPVAALLASNIDQVKVSESTRAVFVIIGGTAIAYLILRMLLKDWSRAALLCTLGLVLFFSYGHLYDYLSQIYFFGVKIGRHLVMIPLCIGFLGIGSWWCVRRIYNPFPWTAVLNLTTTLALAFPIIQIVSFQVHAQVGSSFEDLGLNVPEGQRPPDIYYIILDGYSRQDVLQDYFGFDNSDFLETLAELGFYVAARSQSNYALSALSLASSLNIDYLHVLGIGAIPGGKDQPSLEYLIQHSKARFALENLGYKFITFETGFRFTEVDDADIYYSKKIRGITGFEAMLIQSSALRIITAAAKLLPEFIVPDVKAPFEGQRERVLFVLDRLEWLPELTGPNFVFAHIVSPHSPYVFGPEGEPIEPIGTFTSGSDDEEENRQYHFKGYRDQILYLNSRFEKLLGLLLTESETPPIIILQADHGGPLTSDVDRMAIFNAYYLPNCGYELLYDTISPVNTFRVIFNCYFDGEFELLNDISYHSTYDDVYNFVVIPKQ